MFSTLSTAAPSYILRLIVCFDGHLSFDILFKDLISVYEPDEEVDIFAYKSEDYLDEIRLLTDEEDNAFEVRIAFGLMNRWVQYIRPPAPL